MKTKFKHIYFTQTNPDPVRSPIWSCRNNRDHALLATIEYYAPWRKYTVEFLESAVFDEKCLLDIAEFLKSLNSV